MHQLVAASEHFVETMDEVRVHLNVDPEALQVNAFDVVPTSALVQVRHDMVHACDDVGVVLLQAPNVHFITIQLVQLVVNVGHHVPHAALLKYYSIIQRIQLALPVRFHECLKLIGMRIEFLQQLLFILLCLFADVHGCLFELGAAVFDHFLGSLQLFQRAIDHTWINLVMLTL